MVSNSLNDRICPRELFCGEKIEYKDIKLVAGGDKQETEAATNSPTVDVSSIMLVLSYAAYQKYDVMASDVPSAYLNAELDEVIYMSEQYQQYW